MRLLYGNRAPLSCQASPNSSAGFRLTRLYAHLLAHPSGCVEIVSNDFAFLHRERLLLAVQNRLLRTVKAEGRSEHGGGTLHRYFVTSARWWIPSRPEKHVRHRPFFLLGHLGCCCCYPRSTAWTRAYPQCLTRR